MLQQLNAGSGWVQSAIDYISCASFSFKDMEQVDASYSTVSGFGPETLECKKQTLNNKIC